MYAEPTVTADKNHRGVLVRIGWSSCRQIVDLNSTERLVQSLQPCSHRSIITVNEKASTGQSSGHNYRHPATTVAMIEVIVKDLEVDIHGQNREAKRRTKGKQH